jgi:hypothetical protein
MNLGWGKGDFDESGLWLAATVRLQPRVEPASLSRFALTGECPNLPAGDGPP